MDKLLKFHQLLKKQGLMGGWDCWGGLQKKRLIVSLPELNPLLDHAAARLVKIKNGSSCKIGRPNFENLEKWKSEIWKFGAVQMNGPFAFGFLQ